MAQEPPRPTSPPPAPPQPARADSAAIGALAAIMGILASRLLLLLSVVFAFALAFLAMGDPTWTKLAVLIAFCGLVVLPLTYLDIQSRKGG